MKQNFTLRLDEELVYHAKIEAAKRRRSLSQLVRDYLAHLVSHSLDSKEAARSRITEASNRGLFSVQRKINRDELHER